MTIHHARIVLSAIWFLGSTPLLLLIIYMISIDSFGPNWDTAWGWISSLVFPILSLIITSWAVDKNTSSHVALKTKALFFISAFFSLVYLFSLYLIVLLHPYADQSPEAIMRLSGVYLPVFLGIVTGLMAKFFIENG